MLTVIVIFPSLVFPNPLLLNSNPHAPQRLEWQVLSATGDVVWSTTHTAPPWTWWPSLTPDICQLAARLETWDIPTITSAVGPERESQICSMQHQTLGWEGGIGGWAYGCSRASFRKKLWTLPFYVCPREDRDQATAYRCGGLESYYCAAWGCETTGTVYWKPSSPGNLITVGRNSTGSDCGSSNPKSPQCSPWCNPLNITFTTKGRDFSSQSGWLQGKTWGLRLYVSGTDTGLVFKIRLKITSPDPLPVGPNKVLAPGASVFKPRPPRPSSPTAKIGRAHV